MADTAAAKKKSPKKAAKPATHPTYIAMITAAIKDLKERGGSSRQAILKYIVAKYDVGDGKKVASRLRLALVRGVESKKLKQVKGTGASGSFKLNQEDKPAKAKKPAAKAAKKPAAKKATTPKKKAAKKTTKKAASPKKKAAKKPAAKKPAAKKPAAKKAKKSPKKAAKK